MTHSPPRPQVVPVPSPETPTPTIRRLDIPLRRESLSIFFDLATQFHLNGQLDEAEALYLRIVTSDSSHADGWHQLGVLHHERGDHVRALSHLRRAITLNGTDTAYFCNLGDVFRAIGRHAEAGQCFERVLALEPDHADALCSLAHTHLQRNDYLQAEQCYRRTLELRPDHADVWTYVGVALRHQMRFEEAATVLRRALTLAPDHNEAAHLLAATIGKTTARAPAAYVADLFDAYADTFDEHLVGQLGYDVPDRFRKTIESISQPPHAGWRIADLGCGTGLCGEKIKPWAGHLLGVDISPRMLSYAQRRNVYDELRVADASDALDVETDAFDLVVASDVFIYLGELDHVIESCARVLAPGGLLCFSTEAAEVDYVLRTTGRYAHSRVYVETCANDAGLDPVHAEMLDVRTEIGQPIPGHIHVLRRAG